MTKEGTISNFNQNQVLFLNGCFIESFESADYSLSEVTIFNGWIKKSLSGELSGYCYDDYGRSVIVNVVINNDKIVFHKKYFRDKNPSFKYEFRRSDNGLYIGRFVLDKSLNSKEELDITRQGICFCEFQLIDIISKEDILAQLESFDFKEFT